MAIPDGLLADPADLAVWLGVPADDPKLMAALKAASRRFIGQVHHPVRAVPNDAIALDGDGTVELHLPAAPVTELVSVTLDEVLLVDGEDFDWSADGMLRRLGGCTWPDRYRAVAVVYSHGYDPIPDDIQEAVVDQARAMYAVLPGVQTMQAGGESVTYGLQASVGVTAQWTATVAAYRLDRGDRA